MQIVIIGGGKIGGALVELLERESHSVSVIDSNPQTVANIENQYDVMAYCGNGVNYQIQIEAGVPKADLVVACMNSDESNMLCCMVAKKLGAKNTIARVRTPEYREQMLFMREELGLSMAINPEFSTADEIYQMLRFPSALSIETFSGGAEMIEVRLADNSPYIGKKLKDWAKAVKVKSLVSIVRRGDQVYIPDGEFALAAGDRITIVVTRHTSEKLFKSMGIFQKKSSYVMVIGGGRISQYLSMMLLSSDIKVKIIEKDEARCLELCEMLPKADVVMGDGTNQDLLEEEGIDRVDGMVMLTGMDEQNIILSMFAKTRQVPKIITKINRHSFAQLAEQSGVESVVTPREVSANTIARFIRALQNSMGSNVERLYRLAGGQAEALEFVVRADSPLIGIPLVDLKLKKDVLIGSIARNRIAFIPNGSDTIEAEDRVLVVTKAGFFRDLSEIVE